MITDNAMQVLQERYFYSKESTFSDLCQRVARAIDVYGGRSRDFYDIMANQDFLPNTPCLMGAGTPLNQLFACFVLPVHDSMDSIFKAVRDAALIHKSGGGTGFDFSQLRPAGSMVGTTQGVASGPVSFMKIFNTATEQIKQGGRRKGANMGVLWADHPDIYQFIRAKTCEGDLSNFNISVALPPGFMDCSHINLTDPHNGHIVDTVSTAALLRRIARQAHQNGEPGVLFMDNIQYNTPGGYNIRAVNPCGESPLEPYEPCVLGSINVANMIVNGRLDQVKLASTAQLAVEFLDNCIEASSYELVRIHDKAATNRKIGLGMMGLADALFKLGLPYDSTAGRMAASEMMHTIQEAARESSKALAADRGPCWNSDTYRNRTLTSLAPTGTLSILADCSPGIEPLFSLAYNRNVLDGKMLTEYNPVFKATLEEYQAQSLADLPEHIQRVFVTAPEISWEDHVRMQGVLQKQVDLGVSKTINMPNDAAPDDVERAFNLAWETGCKGLTIYRDGSREEQVFCEICG